MSILTSRVLATGEVAAVTLFKKLDRLSESELACLLSAGPNRGLTIAQQGGRTDLQAVVAWLDLHRTSPHTHAAYEREARRLLLWCARVRQKPLSALLLDDLDAYRSFLGNPQPASDWVMPRKVNVSHPEWRPFFKALSVVSVHQAINVLAALFLWLHGVGHVIANPFTLLAERTTTSRQPRPPRADVDVQRTIPALAWVRVLSHVAALPVSWHAERLRWLVTLFWMGLRISEVCSATMGNVVREGDPATGAVRWWLAVRGNCGRWRRVPVNNELLAELARYRSSLGLTPLPKRGEKKPLVLRGGHRDSGEHLGRGALHKIIKGLFADVVVDLRTAGLCCEAGMLQCVFRRT